MSRSVRDGPPTPQGQPTMTEIDLYRFCRSLLDWEGVHLQGEERVGKYVRVLLTSDEGTQEWCNSLQASEAFRARYGEKG